MRFRKSCLGLQVPMVFVCAGLLHVLATDARAQDATQQEPTRNTTPATAAQAPSNASAPAGAVPANAASPPSSSAAAPSENVVPDVKTKDAGQVLPPAPVVTALDVKPGDRWIYDVHDDITGDLKGTQSLAVTEVSGHDFNVQVSVEPAGQTTAREPTLDVFDDNWNVQAEGPWTNHPGDPIAGVRLPLQLGAKWTASFEHSRHKPEVRFATTASSSVTGWEHVKLRGGGAYDAFRIETDEHAKAFGSEKVIDIKGVQWFAPKVNRFVKREAEVRVNGKLLSRTILTLVSYSRRGADE